MRHELRQIDSLQDDPGNARRHALKSIDAIAGSLQRFGQQKPIVIDRDNVVRAGNGTLAAAKKLGWKEIQVVVTELSSRELLAYSIADNRTAELAKWNKEALHDLFETLSDSSELVAATGFSQGEVTQLTTAEWTATGDQVLMASPVRLTKDQREVFAAAVEAIRASEQDQSISEGRCLEFIAAEFLAGASHEDQGSN